MQFKYDLDTLPPVGEAILYGLQWFALLVPVVIIIGKISGGLHCQAPEDQIVYLQKLTFLMAAVLLAQVCFGHRLPLISGPSSVLLVGIVASCGFPVETVNTSLMVGGLLLFFLSVSGLFSRIQRLFTPRVVAAVLLMIAFTLLPTAMHLVTEAPTPLGNLVFSLLFTLGMLAIHRNVAGIGKALIIMGALIGGTILYLIAFPEALRMEHFVKADLIAGYFRGFTGSLSFDPGVAVSFLVCFMALAANDLGSIQSLNEMLGAANPARRVTRGMAVTGLANVAAGFLGVIGPVNYSLSPGIIAASGCASRYALLPTAMLLLSLSFSPATLALAGIVPPAVIGSVLLYILSSQVAVGMLTVAEEEGFTLAGGLVMGLPLLLGTVVAFLPAAVVRSFPGPIQPLLGNGFVVGTAAVLILEHLVFRVRNPEPSRRSPPPAAS
jgi:xanthine/uracil permease